MTRDEHFFAEVSSIWKEIALSPGGAKVIADIMHMGHLIDPIETADPIVMAQAIGAQNLAKQIMAYVGTDPAQFVRQSREANEVRHSLHEPANGDAYTYENHMNEIIAKGF